MGKGCESQTNQRTLRFWILGLVESELSLLLGLVEAISLGELR